MELPAAYLSTLAKARNGVLEVRLNTDPKYLVRVLEQHPDIRNLLTSLSDQCVLLEREIGRLGCTITRLETQAREDLKRIASLRDQIDTLTRNY